MKTAVIIFMIIICLPSCYTPRYAYSPPTQNIPLLKQKNNVEFAAFYAGSLKMFGTSSNYNRGIDLHTAWAFSNHFGIMLNESMRWEKNGGHNILVRWDSSSLSYKRHFTEIGAGYFTFLNNSKTQFQVFGGTALGSSKIFDDDLSINNLGEKYHFSKVTKWFIQPAFIFNVTDNFAITFSSRFTRLGFHHIQTTYSSGQLQTYQLDYLAQSAFYLLEPAFNCAFGFPDLPVKFRLQMSFSALLNNRYIEYRPSNVGLGIVYNLPKKRKVMDK